MRRTPLLATSIAAALLISSAGPSFANRAAADACATRLPADAKLIYAATIGTVAPGANLVDNVRTKARELVMAGRIDRSQAQGAAQAAGACLKQAL
jgi:hypothetical protein